MTGPGFTPIGISVFTSMVEALITLTPAENWLAIYFGKAQLYTLPHLQL
jgi:hypothetical protein